MIPVTLYIVTNIGGDPLSPSFVIETQDQERKRTGYKTQRHLNHAIHVEQLLIRHVEVI